MLQFNLKSVMNSLQKTDNNAVRLPRFDMHRLRITVYAVMIGCVLFSATALLARATFNATLDWTRVFQGLSSGAGFDVAQDNAGNIYVTGAFANANFDFDDSAAGKQNPGSIGQDDIFVAKINADGGFVWARAMGGDNIDEGHGIAVDVNGSAYTIGNFRQIAEFNPSAVISNTDASDAANLLFPLTTAGADDVFVSKLDAAGNFLWAKHFGGEGQDFGSDIALDNIANVYAVGTFNGVVDFDPNPNVVADITGLGNDVFITSLDSAGNYRWAKHVAGPSSDQGRGIATDSVGSVYVTGYVQGANVDFDPGSGAAIVNSINHDLFLLKYSSAGDFMWVRHVPSADSDFGNAVAVDSNDTIYITGAYQNTAKFDPDPASADSITSNGNSDVFIAAYASDGTFKWARGLGGPEHDEGHAIATDENNNVYISGQFQGTVDFDAGLATSLLTSAGSTDAFVLKLDANGNFASVTQLGGVGSDIGYGLTAKAAKVVTTGSFEDVVDFDPDASTALDIQSVGQSDIFVSKMELIGEAAAPVPTPIPTAIPTTAPVVDPTAAPTDAPVVDPTPAPTAEQSVPIRSVYLPIVTR